MILAPLVVVLGIFPVSTVPISSIRFVPIIGAAVRVVMMFVFFFTAGHRQHCDKPEQINKDFHTPFLKQWHPKRASAIGLNP